MEGRGVGIVAGTSLGFVPLFLSDSEIWKERTSVQPGGNGSSFGFVGRGRIEIPLFFVFVRSYLLEISNASVPRGAVRTKRWNLGWRRDAIERVNHAILRDSIPWIRRSTPSRDPDDEGKELDDLSSFEASIETDPRIAIPNKT